ncbi:MAG TPA: Crp/Fnr family transcriptional regulator [Xanthomonadales bacterium]|nr:Crp/Fnr family transcriptional regulator [Xanthomonadales bacterium]
MTESAFHQRLTHLNFLSSEELAEIQNIFSRTEESAAGELLVVEEQEMSRVRIIDSGWAYRYKSFRDGRRQILNFLVPGDVIGFYSLMFEHSDYGVEALTKLDVNFCSSGQLAEALSTRPRLSLAMSWCAGQSERMLNEHVTRLGRRQAAERMAHLFVELHFRLRQAGFEGNESCHLPLTQVVIADALGMSHVHANRSFKKLLKEESVELREGGVQILDIRRLALQARFERGYLKNSCVPESTLAAIE